MQLSVIRHIRDYWRKRRNPECMHALADVLWGALLLVAVLAACTALSYGAFTFYVDAPGAQGQSEARVGTAVETISREELSRVLEAFEQRRLRFDFLKENPPAVADPSN